MWGERSAAAAIWILIEAPVHVEDLGWVKMRWEAAAILGGCVNEC